ncbi:hypothetical protein DH09_10675 [Bacillaceae bacterium JMAK1]|nr:hypothetical protein DH09_10675 [Bacillaceae bacterium JMAK1]
MKKLIGISMIGAIVFTSPLLEAKASSFEDVTSAHWAHEEINYILEEEIITGYSDGTFRPTNTISRSQTAVMLDRALDLDDVTEYREYNDVNESHQNYDAIQRVSEAGVMTGGSDGSFRPSETLTRAQMSAVLTRAFELEADRSVEFKDLNESHWAYEEIAPVVTNYISTGKNDGTYSPSEHVSRAQFSIFMARALNEDFRTSSTNETFYGGDWTFDGISIGDSLEDVQRFHGEPEEILDSEYGFRWHVYHDEWDRYIQYGIEDGTVVAALSPQERWRASGEISKGTNKTDVREQYGSPESIIVKDSMRYRVDNGHKDLFSVNDHLVTFYYDSHNDNEVSSVFIIDETVEDAYDQYYPDATGTVRNTYETQIVYLANAVRASHDLDSLERLDDASETALNHSRDMARHNYFSHTNREGLSPFDRMDADGVEYRSAAENLARGQVRPLDAIEGWMNSDKGHREALLGNYTHTGVGIAFDESRNNRPYYTQLYYTLP